MYKEKEAVIFDLDGTLIDSMWVWKAIDEEYLGEHGIQVPSDLQEGIGGRSFTETAVYFKTRFGLEESVDDIKRRWNEMAWHKYKECILLKPGARQFLDVLQQHNIKIGLASSNSMELIEVVLASLGIETYFQEIHCSCEVERGKPAPDIYQLVAKCLGVRPENCLVFEDVLDGVKAGKAAGMKVCAVKDNDVIHPKEARELADYYIENFEQIGDYYED